MGDRHRAEEHNRVTMGRGSSLSRGVPSGHRRPQKAGSAPARLWDDVQAVVRILERVEGWTFRTKDACESAVRISSQQALKAWMSVTGPTGTSETMRH
jgi:hypothetical protein